MRLSAAALAAALTASASATSVSVALPGGGKLVAAVGSSSSFRLGVSFETDVGPTWDSDPAQPQVKHVHCYPAGFSDADGGYADPDRDWANVAQGIKSPKGTCAPMQHGTDLSLTGSDRSQSYPKGVKVDGGAAGCCKACDAAEAKNPNSNKGCKGWVATSDGKPDSSGMNCWPFAVVSGTHKRTGRFFGGAVWPPPPGLKGRAGWWVAGRAADWYLSPAKGGYDFTANLYDIIGAPGVPPRYAMAFMATYWGYKSMDFVDTNMTAMRDGNYPIDSFIMECGFKFKHDDSSMQNGSSSLENEYFSFENHRCCKTATTGLGLVHAPLVRFLPHYFGIILVFSTAFDRIFRQGPGILSR